MHIAAVIVAGLILERETVAARFGVQETGHITMHMRVHQNAVVISQESSL